MKRFVLNIFIVFQFFNFLNLASAQQNDPGGVLVWIEPSPMQMAAGQHPTKCSLQSPCDEKSKYDRQAQAEQQRYKEHYDHVARQNAEAVRQAEESAAKDLREAAESRRQIVLGAAAALARLPVQYLSAEQLLAARRAREIAESPLSHKKIVMDAATRQKILNDFDRAVHASDLDLAFELAEKISNGFVDGSKPGPTPNGIINSEGLVDVAKLTANRLVGPFDHKTWATTNDGVEGEIVRRIANKYQHFFVKSEGLSLLSSDQRARFLLGQLALTQGDLSLSGRSGSIQYERGASLVKFANYVIDNITGIGVGFADGAIELVQSVPELADLLATGAQAVWQDPEGSWHALIKFAGRLPEISSYLKIAANNYLSEYLNASPYEKARMVGYLSFQLLTAVPTMGESALLKGLTSTDSLVQLTKNSTVPFQKILSDSAASRGLKKAGHELVEAVERLPWPARTGVLRGIRSSPEVVVELLDEHGAALIRGQVKTAEYVEKLLASDYPMSPNLVRDVVKIHSDLVQGLPDAPKAGVNSVFSRGIPKGLVPDGLGGMRELTESDVFKLSPKNFESEHRFSIGGELGESAMYFAKGDISSRKWDIAEEVNVSVENIIFNSTTIKTDNLLDLTDTNALRKLQKLGFESKYLESDYNYTQALGHAARISGYKGIIYFSQFNEGAKNIVLFKSH